jgi:hypothetical protein
MGTRRALPWRGGIVVTCAGILLAMLGPYGSYLNGPLAQRLGFWLTACWIGFLLYGTLARTLVARWQGKPSDWAGLVIGALAVSIPEAWLARALALWIWPGLGPVLPSLPQWFAQTVLLGLPFTGTGVAWSLYGERETGRAGHEEPRPREDPVAPDIADIGGIIALQMEDHYVRIHRAEGSRLILMPLKQAIRAMRDVEGLQTHRSWWVARSVVAEVSGTPRSMQLRLTNGLEVPVARSAVVLLREAGWLRN